jgi:hypothetical protein
VDWKVKETETCEGSVKVREPRVRETAKTEKWAREVNVGEGVALRNDGNRIPLEELNPLAPLILAI